MHFSCCDLLIHGFIVFVCVSVFGFLWCEHYRVESHHIRIPMASVTVLFVRLMKRWM